MEITIKTLATSPATIQVTAAAGAKIEIISTGKVVAQGIGPECTLEVPKCILWSDATPKLYTCRVTDGSVTTEKKFGISLYQWDGKALTVNGRPVQLRPIHFAATGSAEELARRVLILKDSYFNAIVCDAATEELKAACDYYGLYLLTEHPVLPGDSACCVGNAPIGKLDCVAASALDPMGNPLPACAYATTRWEMELNVRFGVRPSGSDTPLAESWTWPGFEGQKMDVEVYALAPSVELKLNGKSLGKKKTADCRTVYKLPYAPGKLEASAFNGSGTRIATGELESASGK